MTKTEINWSDISKKFSKKELPDSEVEFEGEVPADVVALYKDEALAHIASELELPGFRKGHVPTDIALKKVGDIALLEESVEVLIRELYPALVAEHAADAVGRPDIRITKLAPSEPVGLTVRTAVYPVVTIPKDWKDIAGKTPLEAAALATDEEVEKTIEDLRKSRRAPSAPDAEGALQEAPLPELNDEFAQSLGAFKTLEELRTQIKKGIGEEKERTAKDARRGKIIDKLLDKTQVAVPKIFVESELDKIMGQMQEDVARFGMSYEDYLKRVNKTEEAVRQDFYEQGAKRAKLQLVLNKLAADEKIDAEKEAVDAEMKHAVEHFPEANLELLKIHIETVLRNERVLKILEGEAKE
ncbi:MAG TPA: trigger factor [Candidatus Paceibacterota bacterium]|nr:trigger factor [Candidatus Paceibacterota bacterium]